MIINGHGSNQLLALLEILYDENTAAYKLDGDSLRRFFSARLHTPTIAPSHRREK